MLCAAPNRDGARVGLSGVNSSPPAAHCTAATELAVGSAERGAGGGTLTQFKTSR